MRVNTSNGLVFDVGLSGKEHQEAFTDTKYKSLAGGNSEGLALQVLVDEHWHEWLEIVEDAPWLRNWVRSKLYVKGPAMGCDEADTPSGGKVDGTARYKQHKIASAIYADAVWGYGMSDWLRGKHTNANAGARTRTNPALRAILGLQNVARPNSARTYTWDDKIYRGCGLLVPCEFGELDRWLEPLWLEAQEKTKAWFEQAANSSK